jgi:bacterioferritin-associated ferredoxin
MIICICNNISDKKLVSIIRKHDIISPIEVFNLLNTEVKCGKCLNEIQNLLKETKDEH